MPNVVSMPASNNKYSEDELKSALKKLYQEHKKLSARHTALFKLNELSHICSDINSFYQQLHQTVASLLPAKNFYIVLYDQTFSTLEFVYHVDEKDQKPEGVLDYQQLNGSFTHQVIESAKPLLINSDNLQQLKQLKNVTVVGNAGVDWLGVPLMNDGFVIGVMAVQSYDESTRYQQDDLELLNFAAQHIVSAMTRLQDHERLQSAVNARTKELMQQIREREKSELLQESLFHISELSNKAELDIENFYAQVHNIVGQLLKAGNFYIAKYDEAEQMLHFVYYQDQYVENPETEFQSRKISNSYTELVIHKQQAVLLDEAKMEQMYQAGETGKPAGSCKSWLGVPLLLNGKLVGVMVVQSYSKSYSYNKQDVEVLTYVAQHVSTAIQRREIAEYERKSHELLEQQVKARTAALEDEIKQRTLAEQQLKHTASHDSLTGLPNRMVFLDMLNHAIAYQRRHPATKFAILFLDLDRFKVVNDSLGHHAGDVLLQTVSKELKNAVRDMDTVARLGGDEFVILVEDIQSNQQVLDIAERITQILTSPFTIENQPVFIGTSIGILFCDERYNDANAMLRDADTAMYHAKYNGKGRYEIFDESMRSKVQDALMLESDMREAIERSEFEPYFQPIIDLNTNQVVGFEALARWQSANRGFVMPNDFIPLAEETKLVMDIDLQILEKACIQLKKWQRQFNKPKLYVSCNLFCNHFFSPSLAKDIAKILIKVGLASDHLRLELTERALLDHADVVQRNMEQLGHLGVKILLDDFGTGYSSLSYLHRFPIDVLKIDRSFIVNAQQDNSHRAIIKTIIDLANNLEMQTVGEGIESVEDADSLTKMGCGFGQGYYFAKPLSTAEMEDYFSLLDESANIPMAN